MVIVAGYQGSTAESYDTGEVTTLGRGGTDTTAVALAALPRVPIAFVLWCGDDEFTPSASVVFDASIEGYLDAEAATVLAELASRRMIEAAAGGPNKGGNR